jgi:hypothetical protein
MPLSQKMCRFRGGLVQGFRNGDSTICTKRAADFLRTQGGDLSADPLRKKENSVIIDSGEGAGSLRRHIPNGTFI